MKKYYKLLIITVLAFFLLVPLGFASRPDDKPEPAEVIEEPEREEEPVKKAEPFDIGVFVPGVVAGSPLYELLVAGAEKAAADYEHVSLKVIEGGFNQAEWEEKVMSMAATMEYELILTSNGAMPYVCMPVAEAFTDQKFLIVDAILPDHPQMATVLYNQVEQAFFVGYLGGLITKSGMSGATPDLKVGMIAGQQYPAMDQMIVPGFEMGAKAVDAGITNDFRVLGNWYDANKAAELANSMIDAGVDVIAVAAGGANQGVIKAAQERGKYVLYLDDDHYALAPGTIVGCAALMQDRAVYEKVKEAVEGTIRWGEAVILHTRDGYVDFVDTNPMYEQAVSEDVRAEMEKMLDDMRSGKVALEVPKFWEN
jgi:simple sugar transport system substrate-binding protein